MYGTACTPLMLCIHRCSSDSVCVTLSLSACLCRGKPAAAPASEPGSSKPATATKGGKASKAAAGPAAVSASDLFLQQPKAATKRKQAAKPSASKTAAGKAAADQKDDSDAVKKRPRASGAAAAGPSKRRSVVKCSSSSDGEGVEVMGGDESDASEEYTPATAPKRAKQVRYGDAQACVP